MLPLSYLVILMPLVAGLPTPGAQTPGTQYPWTDTQISNVEVKCHEPKDQGLRSCNMKFDFYDPNSELVQDINGARCDITWDWDGTTTERGPGNTFSELFYVCSVAEMNLFQVQVERFRSASDWSVLVSHKYRDDVHFKAPLNMPNSFTEFAMPELHPSRVEEEEGLGKYCFEMKEKIKAPVIGLTS